MNVRKLVRAIALVVAGIVVLVPAWLPAQEFEKIEGKLTQDVSALKFVAISYAFIWAAVLFYVVAIARGLARVDGEMTELRAQLRRPSEERPSAAAPAGENR